MDDLEIPFNIDLRDAEHRRLFDTFMRAIMPGNVRFAVVIDDGRRLVCSQNHQELDGARTMLKEALSSMDDENTIYEFPRRGTMH